MTQLTTVFFSKEKLNPESLEITTKVSLKVVNNKSHSERCSEEASYIQIVDEVQSCVTWICTHCGHCAGYTHCDYWAYFATHLLAATATQSING